MNKMIQWPSAKYWDHPFNPVIGCKPVSEGCDHCYAKGACVRYDMNGDGQFNPTPKPNAKPPKKGVVFVGNMTDLFGEWNTYPQIVHWLSLLSDNATNLVLTKRVERLKKLLSGIDPLRHVWLGVTAENQVRYDERALTLLSTYTPNARKWLSLEPLLGPIDITYYTGWVVVGAESIGNNPGRPCKLEWVESIVEQCLSAGIPVFVKQLHINGKLVKDISKFPAHLQIRQVPWHNQVGR